VGDGLGTGEKMAGLASHLVGLHRARSFELHDTTGNLALTGTKTV